MVRRAQSLPGRDEVSVPGLAGSAPAEDAAA